MKKHYKEDVKFESDNQYVKENISRSFSSIQQKQIENKRESTKELYKNFDKVYKVEITDDDEIENVKMQDNKVNISKIVRRIRKDGYQSKKSLDDVSTITRRNETKFESTTPVRNIIATANYP